MAVAPCGARVRAPRAGELPTLARGLSPSHRHAGDWSVPVGGCPKGLRDLEDRAIDEDEEVEADRNINPRPRPRTRLKRELDDVFTKQRTES